MKSLITALLLCSQSDATVEETSLMQGMVARRSQLTPDASGKEAREDSTTKLMETATKMMKNGATPDVIEFIQETITEVDQEVLVAIQDEHDRDQLLINNILKEFDLAIDAMKACAAEVLEQHTTREASSHAHKLCRSSESLACARSRKCEDDLEKLWQTVKREESEMRKIHEAIYGEWCEGADPPQPGLADPFNWQISRHKEGDETSLTDIDYPDVQMGDGVMKFRTFSVGQFRLYIEQKPKVEEAWRLYNEKLIDCAALEETWTLKVDECDGLQDTLHDQACQHMSNNRQCASTFGHEYQRVMLSYDTHVEAIKKLEYDRKREWETLHIVKCLLETVYTHVIHSIDSGEPCPTTESHPDETAAEINTCHIVEDSLTVDLDIDYGEPPVPPELPPVVPPPCTAEYIWEEHGSFGAVIEHTHSQSLAEEGLTDIVFADLSVFGWAGCAAPKACTHCEAPPVEKDMNYLDATKAICKAHQSHLEAGELDPESFKCMSGDECISSAGRCNDFDNCADGSDEWGCDTAFGPPAVLHTEKCQEPFVDDVQFRCGDSTSTICTHATARCNGYSNCPDGEDEANCPTTSTSVSVETSTGYTATVETPAVGSTVFTDRSYSFESLGSFAGYHYVKMSNEDKFIRHSHVQAKLRLAQPTVVYVAKLDNKDLPWLEADGWSLSSLEGVSYKGSRETRHTDWSGDIQEMSYGPGQVWQKIFTAGVVEMRGNEGGYGSYLMFMANPTKAERPYIHTFQGCVDGQNIEKHAGKTVEECKALCNDYGDGCVGFEYGVAHGGSATVYNSQDCQLQSSLKNAANCDGDHHNLDLYIKGTITTHTYTHEFQKCVDGENIELFQAKTVDECKALCNAYGPGCKAFEYGVAHGGGGKYESQDCQLQSALTEFEECNGAHHNLDLYIKS